MNRKFGLLLDVQYHLVIAVAMALIVVAVVNLQKHNSIDTMKTLLRVGSAIIAFCWVLLTCWALWALLALKTSSGYQSFPARKGGKIVSFTSLLLAIPN